MIAAFCSFDSNIIGLHWCLANDNRFGPQCYHLDEKTYGNNIGCVVREDRDGDYIPVDVYQDLQRTHQNMENMDKDNNHVLHFLDPWKKYAQQYEHVVWSNFFGMPKENCIFPTEKTILLNATLDDFIFDYVSKVAFIPMTMAKLEHDSRVWYEDHVVMDNKDIGDWKRLWYAEYQPKCQQLVEQGKLQYMWQLNFLHWEVNSLVNNGIASVNWDLGSERLFDNLLSKPDADDNKEFIKFYQKHNTNNLVVENDWYNNHTDILNYLEVEDSKQLTDAFNVFKHKYEVKRNKFTDLFGQYI